ncbi:MAG: hypothetical protein A2Y76_10940 [Planctomycetes bacterium RBG_13_60_9]|nr:MAG: hypothetical protein A2Y76_10940 [Planctomycetes bacterium RBG_13_60_9]
MTCHTLTTECGESGYDGTKVPAAPEQKEDLKTGSAQQVRLTDLAGERIRTLQTLVPGNGAPISGWKGVARSGWFAARLSGTGNIYKTYAESFRGADHLRRIPEQAQVLVSGALATGFPSETNRKAKP